MLVSVVIPNYNGFDFLSACLESCIKQGSIIKEIIVVDDHSSDNSLEVLYAYQQKLPHLIHIFTNPYKGACAARNYGFKQSSGEFIQFLDADDIISPNKIEKQLNYLVASGNYQNKLIHCRWGRFFNSDINSVSWWGPNDLIRKDLLPADWLIANHMSMTGCWLTPRNLIEIGGLWDESLKRNQDGEYFSRLISHAEEVLYCDEAKVYYRSDVPSSVSKTISRDAAESVLKSITLIENYIFKLERSERANLSIANMYQDFTYSNFIAFPDLAKIAESKVKILGGASVNLQGGRVLKMLSQVFGWKQALKIKSILS